jgi:Mce-associated membrane protein
VEVAADGTGGRQVTSPTKPARRAPWLDAVLYGVALVLAAACVAGGVATYRAHEDRQDARTEQERYGDVVKAASVQAEALVNLDYRDLQATYDEVTAGATGDFLKQYTDSWKDQQQIFQQAKSVSTGKVRAAAVSNIDQDSATVMVAVQGTTRNTATGEEAQQRRFRFRVDVVEVDGTWLTQKLEFVG